VTALDFFRAAPVVDEDGERDDRRWIERWIDRHSNAEDGGKYQWSGTYAPPKPHWTWGISADWAHWGLGVDVQRQFKQGRSWPHFLWSSLTVGPWAFYVNVEWGRED
jgi:hypothetical protein